MDIPKRSPQEINEIREDVASRYGLDFPDVVLEPIWFGRRPANAHRVDGRYAIVNQKTKTAFNVCTDAYQIVYHEEIIYNVEQSMAKLPEYGKPEIKVHLLADGGKLRIAVKFPEVQYDINPKVGDIINPSVDIFSSYDLGWKYGGSFGAFRLSCSNGAKVGILFDSFKKRHLTTLDPIELIDTVGKGMLKFSEQTDLWRKWAEEKLLADEYTQMWEELPFSAPEKEKIEMLEEAATHLLLPAALEQNILTRWDFFNVVTQYATHGIKSEIRRIEILPAITKVFEHHHRRRYLTKRGGI